MDAHGQNHLARVRETVATAIIEVTAKQRVVLGGERDQIAVMQRPAHSPGDLADIWYDLFSGDTPGWRGPA